MAKRTAADFIARDCGQLAEVARRVYGVPRLVHAALEVIQQKYPTMDAGEQDRLARRVAAVARATLTLERKRQEHERVCLTDHESSQMTMEALTTIVR